MVNLLRRNIKLNEVSYLSKKKILYFSKRFLRPLTNYLDMKGVSDKYDRTIFALSFAITSKVIPDQQH